MIKKIFLLFKLTNQRRNQIVKHNTNLCALCSSNINEYESTLAEQLIEIVADLKAKYSKESREHNINAGIDKLYMRIGKEEACREISSAFLKALINHSRKTLEVIDTERINKVNEQPVSPRTDAS